MHQRRLVFLASLGLVASASAVQAQVQGGPPPPEAQVSEVVVTSGPLPVSINSATTHVEIMDRRALDLLPPGGLGDTLANAPGLRSTAFAPGASRPVIRGLSGPRVLILQNGVGLVDASSLSPDHAVAGDPGEATRIEVLRGPSTLAYGGSGIGGVVNVLDDRVPSRRPEGGLDGRLSASYGSVDEARAFGGGLSAGSGPLVFAADASTRRSDDYESPDGTVVNSDVALDAYGGGVSYVTDTGFIGASIKQTKTEYGVPFVDEPGGEGPVGIDLDQVRVDLRGEQEMEMGPFNRARLSIGYADYQHQEILRRTGEIGTTFLSEGMEGRFELLQRQIDGWQGAIGVQALSRDLDAIGDEAFIPPVRVTEAGVFTMQRLDRGGWGVEGGLRLDRRRLKTDTDTRAFTNVSGSFAAFLRPADDLFLSLSLSHNRRAPTEVELFADGPHEGTGAFEIGDPDMRPESVNSAEATIRYGGPDLHVETHIFVARYEGFIEEAPTGAEEDGLPVFQFSQTDARFVGAEAEAAWTFWRAGASSLALEGTLDWVRGTADSVPLARIPPVAATARLVFEGPVFGFKAEARRVAGQDRVARFETPTDGYTLVNLMASVKPWAERDVRLFVEARNLTDELAREHVSFLKAIAPMPGRSFRVGLSTSF